VITHGPDIGSGESDQIAGTDDQMLLVRERTQLGDVDVELTLRKSIDDHAQIFALRRFGDAPTGQESSPGLEVQIPASGEPTRAYLEYRMFNGEPLIVAMAQQGFPHEVKVIAYNLKSHEELSISARDDAISPLIERSARERLSDSLEQLVKFGSLGASGIPKLCRCVASGREMFPSDFVVRSLQRHVPVVSVKFAQLAYEVPTELVTSRELLFSCSRYVVGPCVAEAADAVERLDLEAAPLLRLSLSKKSYCQDFTFSIEDGRGGGSAHASHMIHVRDKLTARPLSAYAEIQKVGNLRLHIFFLDDFAPRALRLAVVEPISGWSFQLIVVDSDSKLSAQPFLAASPPRHELLQLFLRKLSAHCGAPALAPSLASPRLLPELSPAVPRPQPQRAAPVAVPASRADRVLTLSRETRFASNDEVVLITVTREIDEEGGIFFKATVSVAVSARERQLMLGSPGIDNILKACGLPPLTQLEVLSFDSSPAKELVARLILDAIEVEGPLELELRLDAIPCTPKTAPVEMAAKDTVAALTLAQTPMEHSTTSANGVTLLKCDSDRILGRIERLCSSVEHLFDDEKIPEATLRVEVFDGSDSVEALFHTTNLRVRVTDLTTGRIATRDVHEEDLDPWLAAAGATHLLCASRETELIEMVLRHASLGETGERACDSQRSGC